MDSTGYGAPEAITLCRVSVFSKSVDCLHAIVAQLVERHLAKVNVVGSSPICRSMCLWLNGLRLHSAKVVFTGSIPVRHSKPR
jgi:hypothetical protein